MAFARTVFPRIALAVTACVAFSAAADAVTRSPPVMGDAALCGEAIHAAERTARVPKALLGAIGLVESGRVDPSSGRAVSWPWTINVEGQGHFYATRLEAIAAVETFQAAGRRSIDVGCMQINLMHHPQAFATLDQAFDPQINATYAAGFLVRLFGQTRDWGLAAAAYHSQTPGVSDDYRRRVVAGWPAAAQFGVTAGTATLAQAGRQPAAFDAFTTEFRTRLTQDALADRVSRASMGLLPSAGAMARKSSPTRLTAVRGSSSIRISPHAT